MYPIKYVGKDTIHQYSIEITPEIAQNSRELREMIFKRIDRSINQDFNDRDDKRIINGFMMFSYYKKDKVLSYDAKLRDAEYNVKIKYVK